LGKPQISPERGTESGTVDARQPATDEIIDQDFQSLHDAWPTLPAAVKAGILAMVRAVKQDRSPV
jgi:hypothetical protein